MNSNYLTYIEMQNGLTARTESTFPDTRKGIDRWGHHSAP